MLQNIQSIPSETSVTKNNWFDAPKVNPAPTHGMGTDVPQTWKPADNSTESVGNLLDTIA